MTVLAFVGCVQHVDLVSPGEPRGVAEFYFAEPGLLLATMEQALLYSLHGDVLKLIGRFPGLLTGSRLRLELPPGSHTFVVSYRGRESKPLVVPIQALMLTPVGLHAQDIQQKLTSRGNRLERGVDFSWEVRAEEPVLLGGVPRQPSTQNTHNGSGKESP